MAKCRVAIKFVDVRRWLAIFEADQSFPMKINRLGQASRHDLCGVAEHWPEFLLPSSLLGDYERLDAPGSHHRT
jgi:hypothetical protein